MKPLGIEKNDIVCDRNIRRAGEKPTLNPENPD